MPAAPEARSAAGDFSASIRGIVAMTVASALLTLSDATSKYLTEQYPLGQIFCLRQLAAFVFLLPYAWAVTGLGALRPVNHGGQCLRGTLFLVSTALILASLSVLPISIVTVVLFSTPLFVAVLAAPMLGERVGVHQWIAIVAGFAGVVLIVRPPAGSGFEWTVLLPIAAAFTTAVRDAYTRRLSRTDSSIAVLFWSGVIATAAGLATIPLGWKPVDLAGAGWFLAAGFFNAAAHFMVIESFRLGDAAVVSPFRYTGLLWAMLVGYLFWQEVPDAWMLSGAAVVVAAGVYMLRRGVPQSAPAPAAVRGAPPTS